LEKKTSLKKRAREPRLGLGPSDGDAAILDECDLIWDSAREAAAATSLLQQRRIFGTGIAERDNDAGEDTSTTASNSPPVLEAPPPVLEASRPVFEAPRLRKWLTSGSRPIRLRQLARNPIPIIRPAGCAS